MSLATILALVSEVLSVLPSLISLGVSVESLIERTIGIVNNPGTATQADLDAAYAELLTLKGRLDKDPA